VEISACGGRGVGGGAGGTGAQLQLVRSEPTAARSERRLGARAVKGIARVGWADWWHLGPV
jgi:hypothetical protein